MSNSINFTLLFKVSIGSINGSETEGNISTIKKITLSNGDQLPYISGQSIRRMIRDRWIDAGEKLSPLNLVSETMSNNAKKAPNISAGNPSEYIDDDLFGYMQAVTNDNRHRTSPVRVSPAIGLFPYQGDRDYGTKSKGSQENENGGQELTGNIFETELYSNWFRCTILVEIDRIGKFLESELDKSHKSQLSISNDEKKRRIEVLVNSIFNLWGGGKQSRILTDFGPKFIIYTRQSVKNPIFLESVLLKDDGILYCEPIAETLKEFSSCIDKLIIGYRKGFIKDESIIKLNESMNDKSDTKSVEKTDPADSSKNEINCCTLAEAKKSILDDIKSAVI